MHQTIKMQVNPSVKPKVLPQDVDLKNTTPVECEKCNSKAFQQALLLRRVSAILTGQGQDGFLPIQVFSCAACGHVNSQFLPEEIRKESRVSALAI